MANITVSSSVHEFMQAADAAAARSALSLGDSAIKNVGTGASQVAAGDHTHEGTEILSTNETGGVKFLREDGDGTCSWQPLSSGQFLSQAFTSQTSVTVTHNFGNYPVVEIIDNTGAVIVPFSVIHASINAFTVTFSVSTTGTIIASGVSAEAAGGGGLTDITETLHTTAPNNTVNAVELEVTGGTTNTDLVLTPKGTGAFILGPEPDGTATGGNKRGANAVDLQTKRLDQTGVASGTSATCTGQWNKASGNYSLASGLQSVASGAASAAFNGSNATGGWSLSAGLYSTASGQASLVSGSSSSSSGDSSVAMGRQANASSASSVALGAYSKASRHGILAHSSQGFSVQGSGQTILGTLTKATTDATPTELFLDNSSARLTIGASTAIHGIVKIVAAKSDGSAVARFARQFTIKNVAGTTSLVGSVVSIGTDEDAGTSIAITANDTNDALKIEVTGIAAENWKWVASIHAVELIYT
jgi:hypothetical protein